MRNRIHRLIIVLAAATIFFACGVFVHATEITEGVVGGSIYVDEKTHTLTDCDEEVTSVVIPDSVTSIGSHAFYECYDLAKVTIPNGVTSIGNGAFSSCESLVDIVIPASVTSIGKYVFEECVALSSINVVEGNSAYSSVDGVLFNKNKTKLIYCPEGKKNSYTIPSSVTSIGEKAFLYSALKSVTIPNSVKTIEEYAFESSNALTSVTIPSSITTFGEGVFDNCEALTNVILAEGVKTIGYYMFYGCDGLKNVSIPASVTRIGEGAFGRCDALVSINVPSSVTNIEFGAFSHCDSLISINVDGDNSKYTSVDGVLFNKNKTTLITFPSGKTGQYSVINGVTTIGEEAFYYSKATDVTLPDSVNKLEDSAFAVCYGLKSVNIPASVTSIGDNAFSACTKLTLHIYDNSYAVKYAKANEIKYVEEKGAPQQYKITYKNMSGATNNINNPTYFTAQTQTFTLKKPTKTGYKFKGWFTDKKCTKKITKVAKGTKKNITVYAKWEANKYKVVFKANGGSGKVDPINTTYGTSFKLPKNEFTFKGHSFVGWTTTKTDFDKIYKSKESVKNLATSGTVTFFAQWKYTPYTITYKNLKGAENPPENLTLYFCHTEDWELVNLENVPGYTFKCWEDKDGKKVTKVKKNSTGNRTFTAKWDPISYYIEYNANGGTGKTTKSKAVKYGNEMTLKKVKDLEFSKKDCTFNGWNTKADGTGVSYKNGAKVKNLTQNEGEVITLYAQWKRKSGCFVNIGTNDNPKYDVAPYKMYQNDERWSDVEYDPTATIGGYGCLITSIAMVESTYQGRLINPQEIIKEQNMIFSNGQIINGESWYGLLMSATNYTKLELGSYSDILNQLKNGPVIVGGTGRHGTHHVVVTGYTGSDINSIKASDFTILNPDQYTDTNCLTLDKYNYSVVNSMWIRK